MKQLSVLLFLIGVNAQQCKVKPASPKPKFISPAFTIVPPQDCIFSESQWGACINGQQAQNITIITPASFGGKECPSLTQQRSCQVFCDYDIQAWSLCDPPTGLSQRSRTLKNPNPLTVLSCQPNLVETKPCAVDCIYTWSSWTQCDGTGSRFKYQTTTPPLNGGLACNAPFNPQTSSCYPTESAVVFTSDKAIKMRSVQIFDDSNIDITSQALVSLSSQPIQDDNSDPSIQYETDNGRGSFVKFAFASVKSLNRIVFDADVSDAPSTVQLTYNGQVVYSNAVNSNTSPFNLTLIRTQIRLTSNPQVNDYMGIRGFNVFGKNGKEWPLTLATPMTSSVNDDSGSADYNSYGANNLLKNLTSSVDAKGNKILVLTKSSTNNWAQLTFYTDELVGKVILRNRETSPGNQRVLNNNLQLSVTGKSTITIANKKTDTNISFFFNGYSE